LQLHLASKRLSSKLLGTADARPIPQHGKNGIRQRLLR
jgi:hypothetical protein